MHGSIDKSYCMNCNHLYFNLKQISQLIYAKIVIMPGNVRVDVVWFGEQPKYSIYYL